MNRDSPSQKLAASLAKCAADYRAMNDQDEPRARKDFADARQARHERLAVARATVRRSQRTATCADCSGVYSILSTVLDELEARS